MHANLDCGSAALASMCHACASRAVAQARLGQHDLLCAQLQQHGLQRAEVFIIRELARARPPRCGVQERDTHLRARSVRYPMYPTLNAHLPCNRLRESRRHDQAPPVGPVDDVTVDVRTPARACAKKGSMHVSGRAAQRMASPAVHAVRGARPWWINSACGRSSHAAACMQCARHGACSMGAGSRPQPAGMHPQRAPGPALPVPRTVRAPST